MHPYRCDVIIEVEDLVCVETYKEFPQLGRIVLRGHCPPPPQATVVRPIVVRTWVYGASQ